MARKSRKSHTVQTPQENVFRIYKTAVYVRLSVEDIRKKMSDSIGTQKTMLLQYIETQPDLQLCDIYEDVNYTGVNFDRPGFSKMIEDIKTGIIDCVIVKDLSRFGRNYRETGNYLERIFAFLQVRFISINDGYDSLTASIDEIGLIMPLKNLINEVYARDISKKVKNSYKLKQNRGDFCGAFAPYGYIKKEQRLIVDESAAPIVRQIFQWILNGYSDMAIAQKLNDLKIPPPGQYRFTKDIVKAAKHKEVKYWYKSSVKRISENPAYTGLLAQGRTQSNFFNGGGRIEIDCDKWIVVDGTHKEIIDNDTFEAVQKIRKARKKDNVVIKADTIYDNVFKGLIYCADCKKSMIRHRQRRKNGNIEYRFLCNTYEQVDKHACTKKSILESHIKEALFSVVNNQIKLAVEINRINQEMQPQEPYKYQYNILNTKIEQLQNKLNTNRRFRSSLGEDYTNGVLNEQDYLSIKSNYDNEKEILQKEIDALINEKLHCENLLSAMSPTENKWISGFRRFEAEQYLSLEIISALVERIEICSNNSIQIYFKYRNEYELIKQGIINAMEEVETPND